MSLETTQNKVSNMYKQGLTENMHNLQLILNYRSSLFPQVYVCTRPGSCKIDIIVISNFTTIRVCLGRFKLYKVKIISQ